jgi:hypothetical protein
MSAKKFVIKSSVVDSDLDRIRSGFNDIVDPDPDWANPDWGGGGIEMLWNRIVFSINLLSQLIIITARFLQRSGSMKFLHGSISSDPFQKTDPDPYKNLK